MISTRLLTLLTALAMLSTSGCSGGRLRNLVTRSDYMSMEELETQDTRAAERDESARKLALAASETDKESASDSDSTSAQLVADQKEVGEEEKTEEGEAESKRRGFFNFAGLFKSKAKDSGIGTDPFIEVADKESETETTPQPAAKEESSKSAPIATVSTDDETARFTEAIASVQKQAEEVFDTPTADDQNQGIAEALNELDDIPASFNDYLAERSQVDQEEIVADVAEQLESLATDKATPQDNAFLEDIAAGGENAFNRLLEDADALADTASDATPFASELFPDLEELTAEPEAIVVKPSPSEIFDEITGVETKTAMHTTEESTKDKFALASEKHGFTELSQRDPWAAFNQNTTSENQSTNTVVQGPANHDRDSFAWANQPVQNATFNDMAEQSNRNVFNTASQELTQVGNSESPFSQVSQSATGHDEHDSAPFSTENSGLMIPGVSNSPVPVPANTGFQDDQLGVSNDDGSTADPFQMDAFAQVGDESLNPGDNEDKNVSNSSILPDFRWSNRTWFLLLGFIIVGILLFLPDRQKRADT